MHSPIGQAIPIRARVAFAIVAFLCGFVCPYLPAQSDTATLSGRIADQSGAVIPGVEVIANNFDSGIKTSGETNDNGIYVLLNLRPGSYQLTLEKSGFRRVLLTDLTLNVQDALSRNFTMQLGPVTESVFVKSSAEETDMSPAVSTVVDQQFVQNMPLNGRTFQSLLGLTPGYVVTVPFYAQPGNGFGQLSINGQRANSNYFMVDGMSWNFSIIGFGQSAGGTIPAFTVEGTTNGLVPVDAMREFRVETSNFAPEFGRTPGAQISIVTRAGSNEWHGAVFDYLRNDAFDARNYFDAPPLPKPPLRQNDFGGALGAPIRKDRLFFFFSYEGLRLLLPETATGNFYTAAARANVAPAFQPLLAALPIPNGPVNPDGITAPLTVAYSDPTSFDSYSLRVDYNVNSRVTMFGRYSRSPSVESTHYFSEVGDTSVNVDSLTIGASMTFGSDKLNDLRANWSRAVGGIGERMTNFYGAIPPPVSLMYPPGYNSSTYRFVFLPENGDGIVGNGATNRLSQRQLEFADVFSMAVGTHQVKFGGNARQLTPNVQAGAGATVLSNYSQSQAGIAETVLLAQQNALTTRLYNYSLFAQDFWKLTSRLALTYGLRWEINTPLGSITPGKPLYNVNSIFNAQPFGLVVANPLWHTRFNNFAPRIGASYLATPQTVIRGAFGLFYDLGFGGGIPGSITDFPYWSTDFGRGPVPFDLSSPAFAPPPFTSVPTASTGNLFAVDPNLRVPLVYEWNLAVQRALGRNQSLLVTYVGSHGVNLLREDSIQTSPTASFIVRATRNADSSYYNALQVQFQRRMSRGLQVLAAYTFGKSLDTGSTDSCGCTTSNNLKNIDLAQEYGPSDFDVRHTFAAAISYEFHSPKGDGVGQALLRDWAVYGVLHINSALPFNVYTSNFSPELGHYQTRPDFVPGVPVYLPDPQPGGRQLNAAAFTTPPEGALEGNVPRNYFRGFPVDQTDLAVSRRFHLSDRISLYFRAEYFNIFNHPMFADPSLTFANRTLSPNFGQITSTLNNLFYQGPGTLTPLYQIGGPRSGQLTLRLQF